MDKSKIKNIKSKLRKSFFLKFSSLILTFDLSIFIFFALIHAIHPRIYELCG